ncbi:MAG: hypothetical protein R3182_14985, partial [Draconibacterium sp.]|nr:hypothetical protein [Draconibacterium sp.]
GLKGERLNGFHSHHAVDSAYLNGGLEGLIDWHFGLFCANMLERRKAIFYIMAGEYEKAMSSLELAVKAGKFGPERTTYREYKPLRSNPRFMAIREQMGLPQLDP